MRAVLDFSALIFDLDGLVLDTESTYFTAWQQAASQMGYASDNAFWQALSGFHAGAVMQQLQAQWGEAFDLQTFGALSSQCWHALVAREGIAVKSGFYTLLNWLKTKQVPYALATNSPLKNALECLTLAGLSGVFETLVAIDHVANGKPAPDIFVLAAEQLGISIQACVILEDSYSGVLAGSRAGACVVYIPSGAPQPAAQVLADYTLESLVQFEAMLSI